MSMSVNSVIANYTFTYKSELRPILDKDADGSWSKEEVSAYAADYESATGVKLDTKAVFSKYDANSDDLLQFAEYEQATADDAFGMSVLSQKRSEAASLLGAQSSQQTAPSSPSELESLLGTNQSTEAADESSSVAGTSEWLQSLDNTTRTSLVNTTVWADNTANMLNMMMTASNAYTGFGHGLMQYTNINNYASSLYTASTLSFNMSV